MGFDLTKYEPVEDRLARWWDANPQGRVLTTLVERGESDWLFRADLYRAEDDRPYATGFAHEVVTQRGVNATSAAENCETSAVGRALANAGYAPKGARPSREEMVAAQREDRALVEHRERVLRVRDAAKAAGLAGWIAEQGFVWPWDAEACGAIEAHLTELEGPM